ncbi:hypothetical protein BATDEDRAFT_9186 [Batrachochytrium dendrobatidis JAM81]|uniref:CCR4-Not complex 3'-5'-exoribonuclease subunit Ccr4 n=2 Tax=Batrachochytrium dendrobatidis TaxID=109871 RepID=F4NRT9_BATDJ|nr:uncharacterized protein BATDEDRAFT_9186 [Batrachochytrium dendrobatidis JAM81]EGF83374.1 hypothetical protein BATDEDRAFT_9186 [Batrachochytrium dendrobatidis JAM81]|eukprot:XP_006675091.1 hypothetical protein BATDEDRAFT_9186 [Batrachochytrium dendrobatidis JAM81]
MQSSSGTSLGANVTSHIQKQLDMAQTSRMSSSPHHHARVHATSSRSNLSSALNIKAGSTNSINNLSDSRTSVASHTVAQEQPERAADWTSLDLGGMMIHNLSKELFRYRFITSLYLNHNNLTTIPPEIANLRFLILLDLSGNKLSTIPAELGLLTTLKELLLFDNELTFLPPELGQLYQLDTIGLEGNPIGEPLPSLLQKDGTMGIITYLRDNCPVGTPPADREWIELDEDSSNKTASESITIMCYNTLCQKYATPQSYAYTPSWALSWEYRRDLILQDILNYNADIVCLQEIDMGQFEDYFKVQLAHLADYEGVFYPKSRSKTMNEYERRQVDGCATLFKTTKFRMLEKFNAEFQTIAMQRPDLRQSQDVLNRVMVKDNIAVMTYLEHIGSGDRLMIANAHLHWDPAYCDVKLIQTAMMIEEVERLLSVWQKTHRTEGKQPTVSTIVCGDLNSLPQSGVVEFLSQGHVSADHDDIKAFNYEPYSNGGLTHKLSLKSAYSHVDVMDFTNFTPTFCGVIDYIWYTTNSLSVAGLLSHVDRDYVAKSVGFPNAHHPSDHIPLVVSLRPKQAPTASGPRKVVF